MDEVSEIVYLYEIPTLCVALRVRLRTSSSAQDDSLIRLPPGGGSRRRRVEESACSIVLYESKFSRAPSVTDKSCHLPPGGRLTDRRGRRSLQCTRDRWRDRRSLQVAGGPRSRCDFGHTRVLTTTRVVIHYARAASLPSPTGAELSLCYMLFYAEKGQSMTPPLWIVRKLSRASYFLRN